MCEISKFRFLAGKKRNLQGHFYMFSFAITNAGLHARSFFKNGGTFESVLFIQETKIEIARIFSNQRQYLIRCHSIWSSYTWFVMESVKPS